MGLGNCAYHRLNLKLMPSVEPSQDLLNKAKEAALGNASPSEPFAPCEDLRVQPIELKEIGAADHLDGLLRNRPDPRDEDPAYGANATTTTVFLDAADCFATVQMHAQIQSGKIGQGQSK